jgi:thiol-disulfide isomerase/thioredoxin
VRADSKGRQTRGYRHDWEARLELESATVLVPDDLARMRGDLATYRRLHDEAEAIGAEAGGPRERPIDVAAIRREGGTARDPLVAGAFRMPAPIGERREWANVEDLEGRVHSLDAYAGRILVLDFWFRECGYCVMAAPLVQRFEAGARGRPVTVLSVSIDRNREDAVLVREVQGIEHPVLLGRRLADLYGVRGCPALVVLGPDGVVRDMVRGYRGRLDLRLANTVAELLGDAG